MLAAILHLRSAVSWIVSNQGGLPEDSPEWGQTPNTAGPQSAFLASLVGPSWERSDDKVEVLSDRGNSVYKEEILPEQIVREGSSAAGCEAHSMSSLEDQKDTFLVTPISESSDEFFCSSLVSGFIGLKPLS